MSHTHAPADDPRPAPAGSWASPFTAAAVSGASLRLGAIALDGAHAWWLEGRPEEGGRVVPVCFADGHRRDVLAVPWSVRSRVHEYGGGAFAVRDGRLWFVNEADQRLHHLPAGADLPVPITPAGDWRHADIEPDLARERLICVREDHTRVGEPANELVAVNLQGGGVQVLAAAHDFYSAPRLSPDGRWFAFIAWDHPHMPWQGATLYLAEIAGDGGLVQPQRIAGGDTQGSAAQPRWAADGTLWYLHEPAGYWNLHRWRDGRIECPLPMNAEFGRPMWSFDVAGFGFNSSGDVIAAFGNDGRWQLGRLPADGGALEIIALEVDDIDKVVVAGQQALLLAGSAARPMSVLSLDLASGELQTLQQSTSITLDEEWLAPPEPVEFPVSGGETARGLFYPPCNPDCRLPAGEKPPLIVIGHGGPTGATGTALDPRLRYWTSRGLAVLDLDYRGSTGYGRAYRESLEGRWGVADVEDAVAGAQHLAASGRVDGARLAIRGSSAGGYLALAAVTFHEVFAAAAIYYGISDLEVLARDTHKFESRYLDWLVGPWPWPGRAALYRERSPIHHAGRITCPLIVFQGSDDKVVPPNQAESLVETVRGRGGEVEYHAFEGEGHGFRRVQTMQLCLERELAFYGRVFSFETAG